MFGTRKKKPWIAVIISLFQPFLAMLFLNRGRWALGYLGAFFLVICICFIVLPTVTSTATIDVISQYSVLAIFLMGAIHAFLISRKWDADQPLHWYARYWYLAAIAFYGFFGVLFAARTYLYQPFNVPSAGMIPTVNAGDFFLARKSAYNSTEPERGDIIVFRAPAFRNATFFKRVAGLPGDHIQIKNSLLVINGIPVPRTRLEDISVVCSSGHCDAKQYEETLPSGRSYRIIQLDPNGPSGNTEVFVVPANSYFVLGDNRDNSEDSRHDLGYVPRDQILGQAAFKYISGGHWTWQSIN